MPANLPIYRSDAVRAIDAAAIAAGTPAITLMKRAGASAFSWMRKMWPAATRVVVVCGPGNNGGDGYVFAREAKLAGLETFVFAVEGRLPRSEEACRARAGWDALGETLSFEVGTALPQADVVVDAVLGLGVRSAPRGAVAAAIDAINAHAAPVLSLDLPSGLDVDQGHAPGACVDADLTVCFVARKRGLHTGAGRVVSGHIVFESLEVPPAQDVTADGFLERGADLAARLPARRLDAHKGHFGHVLAVGGDLGMGGALRLCAEAALRAGTGMVTAITRPEHVAALLAGRPELMVSGCAAVEDWPRQAAARADVLALGPGLGTGDWGAAMFERALRGKLRAGVLDADALNLLSGHAASFLPASVQWVMTPHPGEAARLLGCASTDVQADRFAAARGIAERWKSVVVLKGAGSVVVAPDGAMCIVDAGNPGLAVAGSGDVLTGVIAALLAQGLGAFDAARLGAWLHASAGDDLAGAEGTRGLLAGDLAPAIRRRVNACS